MKRNLFVISLSIICSIFTVQAQKNIVVCDAQGNTTGYFDKLDKAIAGATAAGTIYIPGGNHLIGDVLINKQLHIVGAGHFPVSTVATGRTQLNGNIYFVTGADGSSVTGFYLTGGIILGTADTNFVVNNITIQRCNVNNILLSYGKQQTGYGYFINENVIRSGMGNTHNGSASNIMITKNIINPDPNSNVLFNMSNATLKNNVFMRGYMWTIQNCTFENNIIWQDYLTNSSSCYNNTYINNLYNAEANSVNSGGAIYNISPKQIGRDSIFINVKGNYFDYPWNYHLTETAKARLTGSDGKEVGLYGSQTPFKDGSLPVNPHISSGEIAPTTNPDGNLQIKFKVQAQNN